MANLGKDLNGSQFFITLGEDLERLDGKHTIFGQVEEGIYLNFFWKLFYWLKSIISIKDLMYWIK